MNLVSRAQSLRDTSQSWQEFAPPFYATRSWKNIRTRDTNTLTLNKNKSKSNFITLPKYGLFTNFIRANIEIFWFRDNAIVHKNCWIFFAIRCVCKASEIAHMILADIWYPESINTVCAGCMFVKSTIIKNTKIILLK